MPGLSMKETRRLVEHVQRQGVTATKTKNGVLLRLPNGESTVVHYSVSDYRGPQKLRAQLKRAGVSWPTDPGVHRQTGKPSKQTQERALRALESLGNPDRVTTKELAMAMGMDSRTNGATIVRYLTWAGWDQVGKTNAAHWLAPLPDDATDPFPTAEAVTVDEAPAAAEAAPEAATAVDETPAPTQPEIAPDQPTAPQGREFIDTADSWTADWDKLPPETTLGTLRAMLDAMGLSAEIRTWRNHAG